MSESKWRDETHVLAASIIKERKMTIPELAKAAGLSKWWLYRFFQTMDGNESIVLVNRLHDYLERAKYDFD